MSSIWVKFANWRNGHHGAAYRTRLFGYDEYVPASDLAAARAEIERLTKERDAQYDENVHRIAMQAKAEAERDEARSMLADAERDMRQRAADLCDCACMDGIGDKIRAIGDAILALPLKHADREGGV